MSLFYKLPTDKLILIGYLYDLTQKHRVILLSEKLDEESELILKNRKLFPYLEEIVTVDQYGMQSGNILSRHIFFSRLAQKIVAHYKPSMVFVSGHNLFEIYLLHIRHRLDIHELAIPDDGYFLNVLID